MAFSPAKGGEDNTLEEIFNKQAMDRLQRGAASMPLIVSAVEKTQAGIPLTYDEQSILVRLGDRFAAAGFGFNPHDANLQYLRQVAQAIESSAMARVRRSVPPHVAVQAYNVELTQALAGTTMAWAAIKQGGAAEARRRAVGAPRRLGMLAKLLSTAGALTSAVNTAELAKKWAEEDESPDILSPYPPDSEVLFGEPATADAQRRPLPRSRSGLSSAEISTIEEIFLASEATFSRSKPVAMSTLDKTEILREGTIEEIEVFGLLLFKNDPRGNEQTQRRVDILKQLVRQKMIECGMEEEVTWGWVNQRNPDVRDKERHIPAGERGLKGAPRADLSFKIRWKGNTYIFDINTVDMLKSGLMSPREQSALNALKANRLLRHALKVSGQASEEMVEFEGKVGAIGKGKDLTDDEWTDEAKDWVESFLDCDGPLNTDIYSDG